MMIVGGGGGFSPQKHLTRPAQSILGSKRDSQSLRECCFRQSELAQALLARATESTFFSYKRSP